MDGADEMASAPSETDPSTDKTEEAPSSQQDVVASEAVEQNGGIPQVNGVGGVHKMVEVEAVQNYSADDAQVQPNSNTNGSVGHQNGSIVSDGKKPTAAERKRLKKKQREKARKATRNAPASGGETQSEPSEQPKRQSTEAPKDVEVEVEYVSAPREFEALLEPAREEEDEEAAMGLGSTGGLGLGALTGGLGLGASVGLGMSMSSGFQEPGPDAKTAAYEEMKRVFEAFLPAEELMGVKTEEEGTGGEPGAGTQEQAQPMEEDVGGGKEEENGSDDEEDAEKKMSKKKKKLQRRLKIAELKQYASRPDVVEVWDVTAPDPKALVYLKSYRNTVPVPRHWSQKRKYLQGKRGIEKPPFKLPEFIEATGIGQMRAAYHEKEESKKLKQKQRERMAPKMGKLDIDYQILHDAFFKYQTKPTLTGMGELYYEGKEFEAQVRHTRPGILSPELQKALGMTSTAPPPWLINMQRYGPPPSYPDLKVPGLNAPIPPDAQFGYHPGGWGKPPVDEGGNPLYGDVFGQFPDDNDSDVEVPKGMLWGDLESEEEESEEEEEEESEEEGDMEGDMDEMGDGLSSIVSGISSMPSGLETPEVIDLRKGKAAGGDKPLYTVLEQKEAHVGANQILGTDHVYVVPGATENRERRPLGAAAQKRLEMLRKELPSDVDIAIDPEELETLDDESLRALYETRLNEEKARNRREDFSDLVAEKAVQQKRKAAQKESGKAKKQKETFKF